MSFTVTATQGGGAAQASGMAMILKVITGQSASPAGASVHSQTAACNDSITPNSTGSWVYGACLSTSNALSAESGFSSEQHTAGGGLGYDSGRTTSTVTGGTPITVGWTDSVHGLGQAFLEIVTGSGLAEDASSPAGVTYANVENQTTTAFTPPAGSLLVLMVESNGNTGTTTYAITDTSGLGLTWTEQVKANGSSKGYAGIWTAPMPAPAPPAPPAVIGTGGDGSVAALIAAGVI